MMKFKINQWSCLISTLSSVSCTGVGMAFIVTVLQLDVFDRVLKGLALSSDTESINGTPIPYFF